LMWGGTGSDTHAYTWDGANWTDRGATGGPTTGYDKNAMAFDANLGKVVLVAQTANTTYEWSGAGWTAVAGSPSQPRTVPIMMYDAVRKQVVLFGGAIDGDANFNNLPTAMLADTWVRTGQTWS